MNFNDHHIETNNKRIKNTTFQGQDQSPSSAKSTLKTCSGDPNCQNYSQLLSYVYKYKYITRGAHSYFPCLTDGINCHMA
jgi:hypothetical protein